MPGPAHRKTPTAPRLLICVAVVLAASSSALGAEPRTVDDAVGAALAHPALEALLAGELAAAEAGVGEATALAPPTLTVDHEHILTPDALAGSETALMLEQTLHPGGWRGDLSATVPARHEAARAGHRARRLALATATRRSFYIARHHESRLAVLDGWLERLDRAIALLEAREARGDASRFQVARARRERATAGAERAAEVARLGGARAALAGLTGWTDQPPLAGALQPEARPGPPSEVDPPEAARLRLEARALAAEADAWRGPFGRGWTLGAGYRLVDAGDETGHGVLLSLGVPLALWNPDAPRIARLRAEGSQRTAESERRVERARAVASAGHTRLAAALAALGALPAPEADEAFVEVAESAFGAGEATLEALLDAYDSTVRLRLAALELQWQAREAAIDIDHETGVVR